MKALIVGGNAAYSKEYYYKLSGFRLINSCRYCNLTIEESKCIRSFSIHVYR